jgi:hypothetical protein
MRRDYFSLGYHLFRGEGGILNPVSQWGLISLWRERKKIFQ